MEDREGSVPLRKRVALVDLLLLLARQGVLVPLCPHSEAGGCDAACLLRRVQMMRVDIGMDFAHGKDSDAYLSLVQHMAQKGKPRIKARYPVKSRGVVFDG